MKFISKIPSKTLAMIGFTRDNSPQTHSYLVTNQESDFVHTSTFLSEDSDGDGIDIY